MRLALTIILLLAGCAAARAEPRVEVLDYGLYETANRSTVPMPISVSGKMNVVAHVKLLSQTREIVGQLGNSFGFQYRIHGIAVGEPVLLRTRHPLLKDPATGKSMDYGEREQFVEPGAVRYSGFSFDASYELAEGDWAFEIHYRGKLISKETFKVVIPLN